MKAYAVVVMCENPIEYEIYKKIFFSKENAEEYVSSLKLYKFGTDEIRIIEIED